MDLSDSPATQPVEPVWQRYLTDWNEGLGVVYERFVLNDYLDSLVDKYGVKTVLEAPLYGMAGVSGINSVRLAQRGCEVTLVDTDVTRLAGVERIWSALRLPVTTMFSGNPGRLPFPDASFDLTWAWAALWYLPDPGATLRELARVSRRLVFVAMPNRWQVGYLLRRYVIDRPFFQTVDEKWTEIGRINHFFNTEIPEDRPTVAGFILDRIGRLPRTEEGHPPLVGQKEGVEPEDLADPPDLLADGDLTFPDRDP